MTQTVRAHKRINAVIVMIVLLAVFICSLSFYEKAQDQKPVYVALGDSITAGYGLDQPKTESYPVILGESIGAKTINEGIDGLTTKELLEKLNNAETDDNANLIATIRDADIITISIGSNEILKPFLTYVAKALDCSTDEISVKAEEVLNSTDYVEIYDCLQSLTKSMKNDKNNSDGIDAGVKSFQTDFPELIQKIHQISPDAEIYVNTIYNPYGRSDDGILNAGTLTETYISELNQVIQKNQDKGYTLVEIHDDFWNADTKYVNADMEKFIFDPHPNKAGHEEIASLYESVIRANSKLSLLED